MPRSCACCQIIGGILVVLARGSGGSDLHYAQDEHEANSNTKSQELAGLLVVLVGEAPVWANGCCLLQVKPSQNQRLDRRHVRRHLPMRTYI